MIYDEPQFLKAALDKAAVRRTYAKLASTYDFWSHIAESKARQRCFELAAIKNGERVLEVAVGTGIGFRRILQSNPDGRNEGIDLTREMLVRARKRAERVTQTGYSLQVADACRLPYSDGLFDVVINNYMFDLVFEQDFTRILSEFKRVLCPGGRMVLVNMTSGKDWFNKTWAWIYRVRPALLGGCRPVELKRFVEAAGFQRIHRESISQFWFPSEVICAVNPNRVS